MYKYQLLITLLSLSISSIASADSKEAKKPEPKPTLDVKKMAMTPADELGVHAKFMVGSWHCEGSNTPIGNLGKTYASKGNVTWTFALDNFWLASSSEGEKVPGQPLATVFKGESRVTYDRVAKQFVSFGVGNRGGYVHATSKGWEGDKLVWIGTTSGLVKADVRTTVTRKGDKEYRVLAERNEGGKWTTAGDETCKKK